MKKIHGALKLLIPGFSDLRFACSDDAAEWMFPKSVVEKKGYTVISNGIEVEKFLYSEESAAEIRKELGLQDKFVICHVGRIDVQKNHKFLLEVFDEVLKRKPNSKLLLVGTGPMEKQVKEQAKQLGISENTVFLGIRRDVEKIMCASDAFCLPSLFEGLGIVNIEAQACGLPCYISDVINEEVDITPLIQKESLQASPEKWAERICSEVSVERKAYNEIVAKSKYALDYTVNQICTFYDGKS